MVDSTLSHTPLKRNTIIYVVGVLVLSTLGGVMNLTLPQTHELGSLIFILSPLVMVLVVRIAFRQGWANAGLRLNLKENWGWILFALLAYPASFLIVVLVGVALGGTTVNYAIDAIIPLLLTGMVIQIGPRLLYALSEEWGWRGFLEPALTDLGFSDRKRMLMVSLIWGIWHFPLIISTDYTSIPLRIYLPLFVIGIMILTPTYTIMRKQTGSVWPAVLTHTLANTVAFAIINNKLVTFNRELLTGIHPVSLTMMILWGSVAVWVLNRTQSR